MIANPCLHHSFTFTWQTQGIPNTVEPPFTAPPVSRHQVAALVISPLKLYIYNVQYADNPRKQKHTPF